MGKKIATSAIVSNDEIIVVLMNNTEVPSYKMFISFLRRQPNITLKFLMTNLIQEETLMKNL
jgi:hypothetical protein